MTPDASLEQELRDVFTRHEHLATDLDFDRSTGAKSRRRKSSRKKRRDPGWARALVVAGAIMMVLAGGVFALKNAVIGYATSSVHQENLLVPAADQEKRHVTINGAKNILLMGIDPRPNQDPTDAIRSDSIIILHIPADHNAAFMISIPRDTYVKIPAFNNGKHKYGGGHDKINAAFAEGGMTLTGKDQRRYGTTLLANTIKENWGITFDAAAIVDFTGFQDVVNVLDGVDMYVDERTISVHVGFDAKGNEKVPYKQRDNGHGGTELIPISGVKPQVYEVGYQHLQPWQALDFVRQRELLPNSDYDRQRHQQQFIKALFKKIATKEVLLDPIKLKKVLDVVGRAMTIDNGGIAIDDWIYSMKGITGEGLLTLKTNNGTFHSSAESPGAEGIDDTTLAMLESVKDNTVQNFVATHPDLVTQS